MIYNLVEYLKTQLPSLVFVANGWNPNSPKDSITVRQSGGEVWHWYPRTEYLVQVKSRSDSPILAESQIRQVYETLKNKFGIELPAVTIDGTLFAAVKTYQISPIETPGYIGADETNLEMWSLNLNIITN